MTGLLGALCCSSRESRSSDSDLSPLLAATVESQENVSLELRVANLSTQIKPLHYALSCFSLPDIKPRNDLLQALKSYQIAARLFIADSPKLTPITRRDYGGSKVDYSDVIKYSTVAILLRDISFAQSQFNSIATCSTKLRYDLNSSIAQARRALVAFENVFAKAGDDTYAKPIDGINNLIIFHENIFTWLKDFNQALEDVLKDPRMMSWEGFNEKAEEFFKIKKEWFSYELNSEHIHKLISSGEDLIAIATAQLRSYHILTRSKEKYNAILKHSESILPQQLDNLSQALATKQYFNAATFEISEEQSASLLRIPEHLKDVIESFQKHFNPISNMDIELNEKVQEMTDIILERQTEIEKFTMDSIHLLVFQELIKETKPFVTEMNLLLNEKNKLTNGQLLGSEDDILYRLAPIETHQFQPKNTDPQAELNSLNSLLERLIKERSKVNLSLKAIKEDLEAFSKKWNETSHLEKHKEKIESINEYEGNNSSIGDNFASFTSKFYQLTQEIENEKGVVQSLNDSLTTFLSLYGECIDSTARRIIQLINCQQLRKDRKAGIPNKALITKIEAFNVVGEESKFKELMLQLKSATHEIKDLPNSIKTTLEHFLTCLNALFKNSQTSLDYAKEEMLKAKKIV